MNFWGILSTIVDWSLYWRSNICIYVGFFVALVAAICIPQDPLRWIVGGMILGASVVSGVWWQSARG